MTGRRTGPEPDDDLQRLLALNERGVIAVQDILAVIREQDHTIATLAEQVRALENATWADPLTGLVNARGLSHDIAREEARCRRYHTPAAVVVIEIGDVDQIRREHGASGADALITAGAVAMHDSARGSDLVARTSDRRFVAILPGADHEGAAVYLARVRNAARFVRLPDGAFVPLDLHAGIATRDEAGTLDAALDLAAGRINGGWSPAQNSA